jgi:toxin ParE1/3/4
MVTITWTEEAERWLKDIHDYIAQDNHTAALEVIEGIYERARIFS